MVEAIGSGDTLGERLTTGSAVGQSGTYEQRFAVDSVATDGSVLSLAPTPAIERAKLVSDLTNGALLFTWCGG